MTQARFPALEADQMTARQKEVASKIADGPRAGIRGPFLALLHNPELADVLQQVGGYLRFQSNLSPALIELAILLVARHWTCQFEWFAHERIARTKTDLADGIIRAIQRNEIPHDLSDEQRIVHDYVLGTLRSGAPAGPVFDEAVNHFGRAAVLDLTALCGYYSTIAFVLNTGEIMPPDGSRPLREVG
jgi:4-carboxymuconolactone decarboxylase